ncbi:hypothetical protein C8R43DRAFT_1139463 [Mycena crocata]|nr:hypothetical protein C8R43DRAFT_1139463 [Mycena crocata]
MPVAGTLSLAADLTASSPSSPDSYLLHPSPRLRKMQLIADFWDHFSAEKETAEGLPTVPVKTGVTGAVDGIPSRPVEPWGINIYGPSTGGR